MFIELNNICKRYKENKIIDNMNISINKGDIAGIIGPNGIGKTTTLNIMSGLVTPDKGEVIIDGEPIVNNKGTIGYVPQEIALYQELSVISNMRFFAGLYGIKNKEKNSKIDNILKMLELHDSVKIKVKHLSGGMKRRLNIGTELLKSPKLLIMDEPTVGIDVSARISIINLLKELNYSGMTIVFTSHQMSELENLCTKFYFIKNGKIFLQGTPDEVLNRDGKKNNLEEVYKEIFTIC